MRFRARSLDMGSRAGATRNLVFALAEVMQKFGAEPTAPRTLSGRGGPWEAAAWPPNGHGTATTALFSVPLKEGN